MDYKQNFLKFTTGTLGAMAAGTIGIIAYNGLWPKTIENVVVTSVGTADVYFFKEGYMVSESSPMIRVDKFDDCLRGYDVIPDDLKVGDRVKSISYRSPLFGDCKVLTDLVKEN